jgi:hypothetical protein
MRRKPQNFAGCAMPNPLFQTRTDWTATAKAVSLATGKDFASRHDLHEVASGAKRSSRLSALLAQHEVKKVDWRAVAAFLNKRRPAECSYKPRYVREVAKGFRDNKMLLNKLVDYQIIEAEQGVLQND